MSNKRTSRLGSLIAFVVSGLFVVAAALVFLNGQRVLDQLTVWSYTPSASVATVSERVKFTNEGKFIFYATQPEIAAQSTFNKQCPRQETRSPILGCYTYDDRIYIYDIPNQELNGMEEVTAAHEMLHAVWSRTSDADKSVLTKQLEEAYGSIDDPELKERMEYYQRTEPGEFANELHSILGTEKASLGSSLEAYYSKFFDRSAVLALHQQYKGVYDALFNKATTLYATMETLSADITSRSDAYTIGASRLAADINSFNARANGGSFSSMSQFNYERSRLVSRSNALDADRAAINGSIADYNTYYNEYQEISKQIEVLNNSIDSFKQIEETPSV